MRVKMSKQPPPAPTVSAVGPCPTIIQIVGRPGTDSLPGTTRPPPAENRSRWKGIVANSSVVPRQPSKVMG